MKIDINAVPAYLRPRLERLTAIESQVKARKSKVLAMINKSNRKKRTRALCLVGGALVKFPELVQKLRICAPDAVQEASELCPDLFKG